MRFSLGVFAVTLSVSPLLADDATTATAKEFLAAHEKRIRPLDIKAGKAG